MEKKTGEKAKRAAKTRKPYDPVPTKKEEGT